MQEWAALSFRTDAPDHHFCSEKCSLMQYNEGRLNLEMADSPMAERAHVERAGLHAPLELCQAPRAELDVPPPPLAHVRERGERGDPEVQLPADDLERHPPPAPGGRRRRRAVAAALGTAGRRCPAATLWVGFGRIIASKKRRGTDYHSESGIKRVSSSAK